MSGTRPAGRMRRRRRRGSGAPRRLSRRTGKPERGSEEARPARAPVPEPAERDSDEGANAVQGEATGLAEEAHALAGGRRSGGATAGEAVYGSMLLRVMRIAALAT